MKKFISSFIVVIALFTSIANATPPEGYTIQYVGPANGDANNVQNWDPNRPLEPNDNVLIHLVVGGSNVSVIFDSMVVDVNSITIGPAQQTTIAKFIDCSVNVADKVTLGTNAMARGDLQLCGTNFTTGSIYWGLGEGGVYIQKCYIGGEWGPPSVFRVIEDINNFDRTVNNHMMVTNSKLVWEGEHYSAFRTWANSQKITAGAMGYYPTIRYDNYSDLTVLSEAYNLLPADLNHDFRVNFMDFAIFAQQWLVDENAQLQQEQQMMMASIPSGEENITTPLDAPITEESMAVTATEVKVVEQVTAEPVIEEAQINPQTEEESWAEFLKAIAGMTPDSMKNKDGLLKVAEIFAEAWISDTPTQE